MEHGGEKDSECDPENKGLCYVLRIRIIIIPLWLGLGQAFSLWPSSLIKVGAKLCRKVDLEGQS